MNPKAIGSVIVLVISIINFILGLMGITPLGISEDMVYSGVSLVVLVVGAIGSTWYNFSLTTPAKAADMVLAKIKAGDIDVMELLDIIKKRDKTKIDND